MDENTNSENLSVAPSFFEQSTKNPVFPGKAMDPITIVSFVTSISLHKNYTSIFHINCFIYIIVFKIMYILIFWIINICIWTFIMAGFLSHIFRHFPKKEKKIRKIIIYFSILYSYFILITHISCQKIVQGKNFTNFTLFQKNPV